MKKSNRVPLIALICGILVSAFSAYISYALEKARARESFLFNIEQVEVALTERLRTYELVLRGAAAFYEQAQPVSRADWREYTHKLRNDGLITEVQGIGFAVYLAPEQLNEFNRTLRAQGFPDFTVHPNGSRKRYSSILFLEPFDERNQRAFGYDMYSESTRRDAMHRATVSHKAALSGRVELLQETGENKQAGTLMYVPAFDQALKKTTKDPYDALLGWAYSPFRMTDLINGIIQAWEEDDGASISLTIYDGAVPDQDAVLYSSDTSPDVSPTFLNSSVLFTFAGRDWLLDFEHRNERLALNLQRPLLFLILGTLISIALAAYLRAVRSTRDRATQLAEQLTQELRAKQQEMHSLEERWRFAVQATKGGVWDWNVKNDDIYFSDDWYKIFGRKPDESGHSYRSWAENIHPDDLPRLKQTLTDFIENSRAGDDSFENEYRMRHADGHTLWILDRGAVVARDAEGRPARIIGTVEDVTKEHQRIHQLQSAAETDRLTGLPNRAYLYKYLRSALSDAFPRAHPLAVMFIDLDKFKRINDNYGHDVGDALLAEVASRFREAMRDGDILCRWGGDEFLAVVEVTTPEKLEHIAERLIEAAKSPIYISDHELFIGASIGIVTYAGQRPMTSRELISAADKLMYEVKANNRGHFKIAQIDKD